MAREYYDRRGLRWLCRSMQSIPTSRDGRDIGPAKEALSRLKAGELVKIAAQQVGGGGGGRDTIAQAGGRDPERLDAALSSARG